MKKKVLIGISSVFVLIIGICIYFYLSKENNYNMYTSNIADKKKNSIGSFLTLMLETEADSGVYEKSTSSTWPEDGYIFNENLSSCENGGELSWNEELGAVTLHSNKSDSCYVYFDVYEPTLVEYIINNVYVEDAVNGLYYHDGQGGYVNANLEAVDNSYRYAGTNPNNYVCFGSEESICSSDNLYRIIGVFDGQVKLIKWDYATDTALGTNGAYGDTSVLVASDFENYSGNLSIIPRYFWSNTNSNNWETSELNTINLNTNFVSSFTDIWVDKISNHTWIVGGNTKENISGTNAKSAFDYEITNPASNRTYNAKIGLMYASDNYYAASPIYWSYTGFSTYYSDYEDSLGNNWIIGGVTDYLITPETSGTTIAFYSARGYVTGVFETNDASYGIRPTFYLNSDVAYASGDGSIDNPFRIVV